MDYRHADNPVPFSDYKDSIAGEAHGLVYGARAKTYGHPRFDFTSIGKVWTGLLQDILKDGAEIDPHRVAVLMTGLKLARLVKSPEHHDSRVDTIGYMLTMERLDEPEDTRPASMLRPVDFNDEPDGYEEGYPRAKDENSFVSEKPATGDLQTYVFPVGDHAPFQQKAIFAHSYKEAKATFDKWKDKQKLADAGLGEPPGDEGPSVQYNPLEYNPGPAEVEMLREVSSQYDNPSDQDVETAKRVLERRAAFHDREAQELFNGPE